MTRKLISTIMAAVVAVTTAVATPVVSDAATARQVTFTVIYGQTEARSVLGLINEIRSDDAWYYNSDGSVYNCGALAPMQYDYGLEQTAMQRAAELVISFDHTRPDGSSCFSAFPDGLWSAGENIAYGYGSAESVNTGWAERDESYSGQGHRRNMLSDDLTYVGIGHVIYKGTDYWVEDFSSTPTGVAETTANDAKTVVTVSATEDLIQQAGVENASQDDTTTDPDLTDTQTDPLTAYQQIYEDALGDEGESGLQVALLYLDKDDVPEMFLYSGSNLSLRVYTYKDGQALDLDYDTDGSSVWSGGFSYTPYSGKFMYRGASGSNALTSFYKIKGNKVTQSLFLNKATQTDSGRTAYYKGSKKISKKKYNSLRKKYVKKYGSRAIRWSTSFDQALTAKENI